MAKKRSRESRRAPMGVAAAAVPRNARGKTESETTPLALRVRGIEVDDDLRDYVHQRAGFKLGKYAASIERITVRLEEIGGDKGAPALRCAVKVVLTRQESVMVEVVDEDARAAFDHAIESAERTVRRARERNKARSQRA